MLCVISRGNHLRLIKLQGLEAALPFNCGASIKVKDSYGDNEPTKVVLSRNVQLFRHDVVISMSDRGCALRDSKCYALTVPFF